MISIKFINATNVELMTVGNPNQITYTLNNNVFSCSDNFFSKDDLNYYHFAITGTNVQLSGVIDSVTTKQQFINLFKGCTQIKKAEQLVLAATTLTEGCYSNMFLNCTNLTTPPVLQATTLAMWCYNSMFGGCTNLSTAPALIATTLAPFCYYCMFYGCKNLVNAPNLPAQSLADWCYNSMFYNCQSLSSISSNFTVWSPSSATKNWVTNVAQSGWFDNQNILQVFGVNNIPVGWTVEQPVPPPVPVGDPLTFRSTGNTAVKIEKPYMYYKKNDGDWTDYYMEYITLNDGQTVSFSGKQGLPVRQSFITSGTGTLEVYGNPASLIDWWTEDYYEEEFSGLFRLCNQLVDASNLYLPAMQLGYSSYASMFDGCHNLTAAPQLPAETLANSCYMFMFRECSSLLSAPSLPATELAEECYAGMFRNCTSLTAAPQLSATTLANECYWMMFSNCTSLTAAPQLPATELADNCYYEMFQYCSNLSTVPINMLPATTLAEGCYLGMFRGCSNLSIAPNLPATAMISNCYSAMFASCSNLSTAPQLRIRSWAEFACYQMFAGCSNLNYIEVNFEGWGGGTDTFMASQGWVTNVASNGTFVKPSRLSETFGISNIPTNWTVVNK